MFNSPTTKAIQGIARKAESTFERWLRGGLVCVGVALGSLASQWVPVKAAVKGDYELVQVQVIARHGARTPILSARTPQTLLNLPWTCEPYEKENPYLVIEKNNFVVPYDEYKVVTLHSYGKKPTFGGSCVDGQLTLKGMEQATQLGALLRQRYIVNTPFLPEKYGGDSVYFRSSSTSRTILTARNIVNGLYPLNFRAKEDKVVVHIKADENLYGRSACRNFLELKKLQRSGPKHQSLSQQIKQISEKVTEDTAYWGTRSICGYANDLSALVDHGFPLPKGLDKKDYDQVRQISGSNYALTYSSDNLKRVSIGRFLGDVMGNINKAIQTPIGRIPKLVLISGHDNTLGPLLNTLQVFDGKHPRMGSAFIIELWKNSKGEHFFQFFKYDPTDGLKPLRMPDCKTEVCPINILQNHVGPLIPTPQEYDEECFVPKKNTEHQFP